MIAIMYVPIIKWRIDNFMRVKIKEIRIVIRTLKIYKSYRIELSKSIKLANWKRIFIKYYNIDVIRKGSKIPVFRYFLYRLIYIK